MKWIQTGRQLGQAVKNVQRLRQVIAVFAKHGFADVLQRMDLGKYLPKKFQPLSEPSESEKNPATRLRESFEELGPTYVKLGQLLSTRSDLIPENFIEEFTKLQDNVLPVPATEIKNAVEKSLNKTIIEAYQDFNPEPLASASIAQVHEATLHTGEKVVVKVQRPGIDKIIETDVSLLAFLARLLEKYVPETRIIGPTTIVDEFFRTLTYELDFNVEANNIRRIRENLKEFEKIVVPKVYKDLSSTKILTLEKIEGVRVDDSAALDRENIDRKEIVKLGNRAFMKSVLVDGIFHGDLHAGNLFVMPGNRIGIIDFGIVGRLSEKSRDLLANMVMALVHEDFEKLCYYYAELGTANPSVDFKEFERDLRNTISPYMGLKLNEINSGKILIEATKIATKYQIRVPGEWMIVFKAIVTIEGMGKNLAPDFDMLEAAQDIIKNLIKSQYSPQRFARDLMYTGKELAELFKIMPRQIRWMFKKFNSNDFAFEFQSKQIEEIRLELQKNSKRTSLSIVIAAFMIAASISLEFESQQMVGEFPLVTVVLFVLAILFMLKLLRT